MDFFTYLQNSGKESLEKKQEREKKQKILDNTNDQKLENINEKHIQNTNFKKGEVVMITKFENSMFNIYKGYYAEIKKYNQNSDHAYVILPALNYPTLMKIPIGHFTKLENINNY